VDSYGAYSEKLGFENERQSQQTASMITSLH
jgi:hypothetical protein